MSEAWDRHKPAPARRAAAWSVHLLTASGAAWALLALHETSRGRYRAALAWMTVAFLIDAVDGTLARLADVRTVVPVVDGSLLDNLIDYLNYVVVPAYLLLEAGVMPAGWGKPAATAICLASAFQFVHVDAKSAEAGFRGFPSYWNVVVFYLLVLDWPPWISLGLVAVLCLLVFVPVYYVYPSRMRKNRGLTLSLTAAWSVVLAIMLVQFPTPSRWLVNVSLLYPLYYFAISLRSGRQRSNGPQR